MASVSIPDVEPALPDEVELETIYCRISREVLIDPVIAPDKFVYERSVLQRWLETKSISPMTRQPMSMDGVMPCYVTRHCVRAWKKHVAENAGAGPANPAGAQAASKKNAPRIQSKLLENMRKLSLKLPELGITSVPKPCIAVVGQQSAGKSTLLEVLVGVALFPRDAEVCTKMRIRAVLERSDGDSWTEAPTIRIVPTDPVAAASATTPRHQYPPELPFDYLPEVLRNIMDDVVGDNGGFVTDREIEVTIKAPFGMQLEIVDLPGLPGADGSPHHADAERLIKMTIAQLRDVASFVWVHDVSQEFHSSSIGSILQAAGVLDRTFGVFTKLDTLKSSDPDVDPLTHALSIVRAGHPTIKLQHPWHAVSCRASGKVAERRWAEEGRSGSKELHRLLLIHEKEDAFLRTLNPGPSPLSADDEKTWRCIGQDKLRQFLQTEAYEKFVTERWVPFVLEKIFKRMVEVHEALVARGLPFAPHTLGPAVGQLPQEWAEARNFATKRTQLKDQPAVKQVWSRDHTAATFARCLLEHVDGGTRSFRLLEHCEPFARARAALHQEVHRIRDETTAVADLSGDVAAVEKCLATNAAVLDALSSFGAACDGLEDAVPRALCERICAWEAGADAVSAHGPFVAERCGNALHLVAETMKAAWMPEVAKWLGKVCDRAQAADWATVTDSVVVPKADALDALDSEAHTAVLFALHSCVKKASDALKTRLTGSSQAGLTADPGPLLEVAAWSGRRDADIALLVNLGRLVTAIETHQELPDTAATSCVTTQPPSAARLASTSSLGSAGSGEAVNP